MVCVCKTEEEKGSSCEWKGYTDKYDDDDDGAGLCERVLKV